MDCRGALEWFFCRHHERLVLSVRRILGSAEEAQDVAQEAYVLILIHGKERGSDHLRHLLFTVARHRALDRLRRRKRHAAYLRSESACAQLNDQDGMYEAREALRRVERFLEELPAIQRSAFVWCRLEDLSQMSIARRLAVSQGSVTRYVSHARDYCALRLEGYSREEAARRAR